LREYIGGRGLGAKLIYDMMKLGVDPLSVDNIFLVLTGPLTGILAPGGSKYVVVTKLPATGGFVDSYSSGNIAAEIKYAEYDCLILKGKAPVPSILKIYNKQIDLFPAKNLWGKDAFEAEKT
jgi:aldehyde:ferredoxin oxidoreductase